MAYFIRAASLAGFEDLVRHCGENPMKLLQEVGILACQLRNPDELISYQKLLDVLELGAKRCNLSTFGLRLSSSQGMKCMGLVGAYMCQQKTVEEALRIGQKYIYMHAQGMDLSFNIVDDIYCQVEYQQLSIPEFTSSQKPQLTLGVIFKTLNDLCGLKWRAKKVLFKQPPNKDDIDFYQQFFACDIEFNASINAIQFHSDFLKQKPIVHQGLTDEIIHQQFEQKKVSPEQNIIALIEHTISILLATGECNKENIALCLGLHPKKMQRILQTHNTSYQVLLDKVRKKESLRVLALGNADLTNLALNLGYADFSAFSRRFKRWFGVPPSKWTAQ